ncbi:hypothetical protein RBSWK_01567 [Rhodopirellula baltica SWK14]|uniref:Uncharacterized protein n=1 Tax=Rhodopirellula baltica SWK14 TaxID=993516 RepID=L7CN77_RHOBT|nr:hypothetical protein RBSWK_01567 [Rhodopirellula baltica SWK14]
MINAMIGGSLSMASEAMKNSASGQSDNVADHPVGARNPPLSKRPTRRLGCIRWFPRFLAY